MSAAARPTKLRDKWRIRWLDHEGKRCSCVFDSYEQAERELRKHQVEADEVKRGERRAPPPAHTFNELADYWVKHRASQKRSKEDDTSILKAHLRPAFGALLLRDMTTEKVDAFRTKQLLTLKPKTVRNHLVLLGSVLKLGTELQPKWMHELPTIKKPSVDPDNETDQPWLKEKEDIKRLLDAARARIRPDDVFSHVPFVMYSTAVYTGMRAGECAGLRWSDIDLTKRTIHVRRSYGGKTKTRASRRFVPVVDVLLPVLQEWKQHCPATSGDLVCPNANGMMFDQSARIFQETLHQVLDAAGFERPPEGSQYRRVIHFHSLRHTFACHWRLNGGALDPLIRVLGHTSRAMTEHYANIGGYHEPSHFSIFGVAAAE